jgi:predicted dehydrogenase
VVLGERDIILYHTGRSTLPEGELAGFRIFVDLDEALAEGPQAVIIATPTAMHLDSAIPAARAGCHLLIEKPLSHTLERVDELLETIEAQGLSVLMGYQYRYHPGLMDIKQAIDSQSIGKISFFRAHWGEYLPDWHPWEDYRDGYSARADLGGGVLLSLCHPIDYSRWLFGEAQVSWAFIDQKGDLELDVDDVAEIGLNCESGAIGSIHLDYLQRPARHYLEIIGTEGTIFWDNREGGMRIFKVGVNDWEYYPPPPGFERNTLFIDEMRHFLDIVRGNTTPLCTLEDGIRSLELISAAKIAGKTEKAQYTLDPFD